MQGLRSARRIDIFLGLLIPALFLAVNLATSSRSPVVWQDEVMFADPAVNLALGRGFTTSAWFQDRGLPFAGNSPLYSLCLSPWIAAFGLEVTAVRALNYVLVLGAVGALILALARLGLVQSPWVRAGLAVLVLCGDGVTYSYRSGRYDCLGMLLVAALGLSLTISSQRARAAALVVLGCLVPWAGLQLVPYLVLVGLLLVLVRGRPALADLGWAGAGVVLGLGSLVAFFQAGGVWGEFLRSVSILAGTKKPLLARLVAAAKAPWTEPSSVLVLAALAVGVIGALRRGEFHVRSPLGLGVVAGVLVPAALALTGKYARYYCWMAFLPMAACMAAELQHGRLGPLRKVVLPLLVLASLAGLPARLAVTCREWSLRDTRPVDAMVAAALHPTDWVYSDYEAYYPAKRAAAALFLPPYAGLMPEMDGMGVAPALTAAERDAVDVLIVKPSSEERTLRLFGGRWSLVARYSAASAPGSGTSAPADLYRGSQPYDLRIYRRQPGPLASAR
jgi:hypothetical protein